MTIPLHGANNLTTKNLWLMKYKVKIVETLSRIVEVDAKNADDAWGIVKNEYDNENIVLDSDDFDGVEFYNV